MVARFEETAGESGPAEFGRADLHAHSRHDRWGDGNQTVEELLRYVEEQTNLDIFAITDHDSTDAARAAREEHGRGTYRFAFLPGVEVTNTAGHLLCYFPGEIFDVPSLRSFWWTVQYVHERGGICIPAHPIYPPWLRATLLRDLGRPGLQVDAVEAENGGISPRAQWRLRALGEKLQGKVALVGNSDAHHRIAIGSVYTVFPGSTIEDYLAALTAGTTRPCRATDIDIPRGARLFSWRRSMTRPGWVRNLYRQMNGQTAGPRARRPGSAIGDDTTSTRTSHT